MNILPYIIINDMSFYKVIRKVRLLPYVYGVEHVDVLKNHCIIDIETTGLCGNRDIIICYGLLDIEKERVVIYFLEEPRKHNEFRKFLRTLTLSLIRRKKVWAYNKVFEEIFLNVDGLMELLCYRDLYWIKGRAKMDYVYTHVMFELAKMFKDNKEFMDILKWIFEECKKDITPNCGIPDVYIYEWVFNNNVAGKMKIIEHNYADLLKEYIILYYMAYKTFNILEEIFKEEHYILGEFVKRVEKIFM